jgi:hypothetical protein
VARTTGIRVRHSRSCRTASGGRCNCRRTYEASVGAAVGGQKLRRPFKTLAAARAWQAEARVAVDRGQLRAGPATSLNEAADELEARRASFAAVWRLQAGGQGVPCVTRGLAAGTCGSPRGARTKHRSDAADAGEDRDDLISA